MFEVHHWSEKSKSGILLLCLASLLGVVVKIVYDTRAESEVAFCVKQVESLAKRADCMVDRQTGAYIRLEDEDIHERDAWGKRLRILYETRSATGTEALTVLCAGRDGAFMTKDDFIKQRITPLSWRTTGGMVQSTIEEGKGAFKKDDTEG